MTGIPFTSKGCEMRESSVHTCPGIGLLEQYELEIETGLTLSGKSAQSIVDEVGAVVGQNINMMDPEGCVIASTDESRIGSIHEGAVRLVREHLQELYVEEGWATPTSRPGINLPITHRGMIVGVIGITGIYTQVAGYGQVVKRMVEILIRENAQQNQRRMGQRMIERFLEDWVIGSGPVQPGLLAERGQALGIDITVPRRVMVASAREPDEYALTSSGQRLLEQVEREVASLGGRGSLVLQRGGKQILLVKKCTDFEMEQLAEHIRTSISERFSFPMVIGIDGRAGDIRAAYGQANKAWRSAAMAKKDILTYDSVTLELFTGDLDHGVKVEYIRKLFKKCSYEELCQWMVLLRAYFEAEGSLQTASGKLHIHKNTLTYKLKRLEETTGYDVRQVSQTAVFHMAMLFFRDVKDGIEEVW